jgi:prevent-host-death family protein
MSITTLSSRQFNQDTGGAKRASQDGPVVITDRGRPSHVLLSYAEFKKITRKKVSLFDALLMPGMDQISCDIEIPPRTELPRAADLS